MKDHHQTHQTTNPGTSETSAVETKKSRGAYKTQQITQNKFDDLIDTMSKFESRILKASMAGEDYLEVSPEVFDYYTKGQNTPYFTYGPKGIKVYKVGTREACEALDSMTIDEAIKHEAKKAK